MESLQIKKNGNLLNVARMLRRNMTPQERHLWYDFLRGYSVKIYKQRIIEDYIVDFYCHKARLVIELDGAQHYTEAGKAQDAKRALALQKYGIEVLRFSNKDVNENFEGVCYMIDNIIKNRISLSQGRGGGEADGEGK